MPDLVDEQDESTTPIEFVVLSGLRRAIGWLLAIVVGVAAWLVATITLVVLAFRAPMNSFLQSLWSDVAVTLCLFALAPMLFNFWRISDWRRLVGSLVVAVGLIAVSALASGAGRSMLMGLGCGVGLLLVLDYWIQGSWNQAMAASARKTDEEYRKRTMVI